MAERKIDKSNSKKVVQDIYPNKKTIRNIALEEKDEERSGRIEHEEIVKKLVRRRELKEEAEEKEEVREARNSIKRNSKGKRLISNTLVTFSTIFVGVAIIGIALSLLYSKAVITITPKIVNFELDQKVTAKKNSSLSDLQYEILTATTTLSKDVPYKKGALIETKAKGIVTLYNANSTSSQKILAGTRLSTTDGLVYRTSSTIVIPGMKTVQGKTTPGAMSVYAVADIASEKYNTKDSSGQELKIMAYKGSSKYNTIYGKIKNDFTGGYSGYKVSIDPKVEKATVDELKNSLKQVLENKIKSEINSNLIYYPKLTFTDYTVIPAGSAKYQSVAQTSSTTSSIVVQGVINIVVFRSDALFKYIAQDEVSRFPSSTYKVDGLDNLSVILENPKDFSPKKMNSLILSMKGKLKMTGTFNEEALKQDLVGKKMSQSNSIFAKYTAISNAYALITPFWMRSFPNTKEKIILNIKSD